MIPLLETVKVTLGVVDDAFDSELLIYINAAITRLSGFGISEFDNTHVHKDTPWPDFDNDMTLFSLSRAYIPSSVRLVFDPPANESVMKAYKTYVDELELNIQIVVNEIEGGAI